MDAKGCLSAYAKRRWAFFSVGLALYAASSLCMMSSVG